MNSVNSKQYPIITVLGDDKTGIVAQVSAYLWDMKINIEEIQQGVMKGKFFMVMSVDISGAGRSIAGLTDDLESIGEKIGVKITIYDQGIFTAMHKI